MVQNRLPINGKFPAWRGEGVFEGSFQDAKTALVDSGRNYITVKRPLFALLPPDALHPEEYYEKIEDVALYRGPMPSDPNRRYISVVSPRFEPVQHRDMADALCNIPQDWPLVMIGSAGRHNTHVFWGFDAGTYDLLGKSSEQHQQYIYIDSENDGGSSIHMMGADIRMSCLNMYPMVTKNASFNIRLRHGSQALTDVQQWTKYFHRLQEGMKIEISYNERMATTKMAVEQFGEALMRILHVQKPRLVEEYGENGHPGLPDQVLRAQAQYQNLLERTKVYRVSALEQFERINDESPAIAGTVYAAFNSVTFLENWRQGRGGEGAVESVMYGDRAKTMHKAREVLLSYAN